MKPARRRLLLGLGLAGALALTGFVSRDDDSVAASAPRAKHGRQAMGERGKMLPTAAATNAAARVGNSQLPSAQRPPQPAEVPDLFKAFSWYVPPPPPPPAPTPARAPEPTAPPLPFAYLGQYADDDRRLLILTRNDRVVTVAIGDVIDKTYLVERMTGGLLTFVYLPLAAKQTLDTGVLQ